MSGTFLDDVVAIVTRVKFTLERKLGHPTGNAVSERQTVLVTIDFQDSLLVCPSVLIDTYFKLSLISFGFLTYGQT